jgi:hypothetical protein
MPPASHNDRSKPQGQRAIQVRDSASILLAHFFGRSARNSLCIKLMFASSLVVSGQQDRATGVRCQCAFRSNGPPTLLHRCYRGIIGCRHQVDDYEWQADCQHNDGGYGKNFSDGHNHSPFGYSNDALIDSAEPHWVEWLLGVPVAIQYFPWIHPSADDTI